MVSIKVDEEIVLKQLHRTDAHDIFNAIDENRLHLKKWLPFVDATKSEENTMAFIHNLYNTNCPKKDMVFRINFKDEFAGLIGLKEIDYLNKKTEIGYWLIEKRQGNGIIYSSAKALLKYCFTELDINRIQIKAGTGNIKSNKIPERLDFKPEGIERNGELINGEFIDLKVYSLLKEEWIKSTKHD